MSSDDPIAATERPRPSLEETLPASAAGGAYEHLLTVELDHYADRTVLTSGGMGRIVAAFDRRLRRRVAIKELRTQSPDLQARFKREALLTAKLEHPNIVSIHEAGTWPSGEPFYSMKLVAGRPFDRVIADGKTLNDRLTLLPHVIAVADALAYAHQERVIHRDLKPQNVMVGEFGETVVIDWGLGKDLDTADEAGKHGGANKQADASETADGEVLGTPAYMPPEQAEGKAVDERADVYAIGAILYHLLAGAPPFAGKGSWDVVEAVKKAPPRPLRDREPGAPADLLAIAERAMARDASDRYSTAKGLADDLKRFQSGQLVGAHRYSLGQLVRRWLRRHRTAVAVGAVAAAILVAVGIVSLSRIIRAERQAREKQALADEHRVEAEGLLDFMLFDLRDKLQPMGRVDLLGAVAQRAGEYYERRTELANDDERRKRGVALSNLADVLNAEGDAAGALARYRAALAIAVDLAERNPNDGALARDLATRHDSVGATLLAQGDSDAAMQEFRAALAIRESLASGDAPEPASINDLAKSRSRIGDALLAQGDSVGALEQYRNSLVARQELAASDPAFEGAMAESHINVGKALAEQGERDAALAEHRAALDVRLRIAASHPDDAKAQADLASSHRFVGRMLQWQRQVAPALMEFEKALSIREKLAAHDPINAVWEQGLSMAYDDVADALALQGDHEGALEKHRAGLLIAERVAAQNPSNADWQRNLSGSHEAVAEALLQTGDVNGAVDEYGAALSIAGALVAKNPRQAKWQSHLAMVHSGLASALLTRGDGAGALEHFQKAISISEMLSDENPKNAALHNDILMGQYRVANLLEAQGDWKGGVAELRKALGRAERLRADDPSHPAWPRVIYAFHNAAGNMLAGAAQSSEAIDEFRDSLEAGGQLPPSDRGVMGDLAGTHENLADALLANDDPAGAKEEYRAAIEILQRLAADAPPGDKSLETASRIIRKLTACCAATK